MKQKYLYLSLLWCRCGVILCKSGTLAQDVTRLSLMVQFGTSDAALPSLQSVSFLIQPCSPKQSAKLQLLIFVTCAECFTMTLRFEKRGLLITKYIRQSAEFWPYNNLCVQAAQTGCFNCDSRLDCFPIVVKSACYEVCGVH